MISKKHPSLLFDRDVATDIDIDSNHSLGLNGLEEFISIDQSFEPAVHKNGCNSSCVHVCCQWFYIGKKHTIKGTRGDEAGQGACASHWRLQCNVYAIFWAWRVFAVLHAGDRR